VAVAEGGLRGEVPDCGRSAIIQQFQRIVVANQPKRTDVTSKTYRQRG
jgi:hypothetical protein